MRRVLFEWRGVRIWSYPTLLYVGLVIGVVLQYRVAPSMGLAALHVYWATLTLLPIALAGSRVLFVATHWASFRQEPRRIWRRGEGGLAMYGGVPFMLAASVVVLPLFRLPFWAFWDSAVFCIFPGMAFARIGCLLNGCCSGRVSNGRFSLWLPNERGAWAWRIPVQLLEFATALTLLGLCAAIRPRLRNPGTLFLLAMAGYGTARIVLQALRDRQTDVRRLDVQTAISFALIVLALSALTWIY